MPGCTWLRHFDYLTSNPLRKCVTPILRAEITASSMRDPVCGEQVLLLLQVDVTARVRAERRIQEVLEAEHKLLESVFPRCVCARDGRGHWQGQGGGHGGRCEGGMRRAVHAPGPLLPPADAC